MLTKRLIVTLSAVTIASLCGLTAGMANDEKRGGDGPSPALGHKGEGRLGGPGGPGGLGGPGMMAVPMSDEQVDLIMEVLKDADPEYAVKVEKARKENPGAGQKLIGNMGPRLMRMVQLKKNDPEMYALRIEDFKINRKVEALVEEIRKGGAEAKGGEGKQKELKELLNKHFDIRQQVQEKELQRLEKEVTEMRERINRRKANKESMLNERFKELTEKQSDKDW